MPEKPDAMPPPPLKKNAHETESRALGHPTDRPQRRPPCPRPHPLECPVSRAAPSAAPQAQGPRGVGKRQGGGPRINGHSVIPAPRTTRTQ